MLMYNTAMLSSWQDSELPPKFVMLSSSQVCNTNNICCQFVDSSQPSMFILFESNLHGACGTNPQQHPSSIFQV
jgi:hypothetical protein